MYDVITIMCYYMYWQILTNTVTEEICIIIYSPVGILKYYCTSTQLYITIHGSLPLNCGLW